MTLRISICVVKLLPESYMKINENIYDSLQLVQKSGFSFHLIDNNRRHGILIEIPNIKSQ
jgi:hypothetical protein